MFIITPEETYPYLFREHLLNKRLHDGLKAELMKTAEATSEETAERYGYFIGRDKGQAVQVAPYRNRKGQVVGQKVRGPNKSFYTTGDFKDVQLFGQHLFKTGGKRVLVVEGEIDALSGGQMLGTWPVVSLPSGAAGAVKAVNDNIEWLESYERVVFGFDMDEPGREAASACAALLSPGKAAIMELPRKDANEMLVDGMVKEFVTAFWEAREYRPDGIVRLADIRERILTPPEMGLPWWLESLSKVTYGRRLGETYAFGAGTGIGKTDFLTQQIQYDVDVLGEKVGLFFLEQSPSETAKRVANKFAGKRFHVPDGSWTQDELVAVIDRLQADDRLFFYDNFGALEWGHREGRHQVPRPGPRRPALLPGPPHRPRGGRGGRAEGTGADHGRHGPARQGAQRHHPLRLASRHA
jgi:twinkle protein